MPIEFDLIDELDPWNRTLFLVVKIRRKPIFMNISNIIVSKFFKQDIVIHHVKDLFKVSKYSSNIISSTQQLKGE